MARALAAARKAAEAGEVPVGAVVVHAPTGRVLAEAGNRVETDRDPTAHAEMLAIRAAASSTVPGCSSSRPATTGPRWSAASRRPRPGRC